MALTCSWSSRRGRGGSSAAHSVVVELEAHAATDYAATAISAATIAATTIAATAHAATVAAQL